MLAQTKIGLLTQIPMLNTLRIVQKHPGKLVRGNLGGARGSKDEGGSVAFIRGDLFYLLIMFYVVKEKLKGQKEMKEKL